MRLKEEIRLSLGIIQKSEPSFFLMTISILSEKIFLRYARKFSGNVWFRNSNIFKAQIPFFSDIDITLVSSTREIAQSLKNAKKFIPTLGEINFYHPKIQDELFLLGNPYELLRDPILCQKFALNPQGTESTYICFFVRHFLGDQKWLLNYPELRTKKWNYLSNLMNHKLVGALSYKKILEFISNESIRDDIKKLARVFVESEDLHRSIKDTPYRYLYPQAHIWNLNDPSDRNYLKSLNKLKTNILLDQINWEFWGIGCHYYWLDQTIMIQHLERMLELYQFVAPELDTSSLKKILHFIQEENPSKQ